MTEFGDHLSSLSPECLSSMFRFWELKLGYWV